MSDGGAPSDVSGNEPDGSGDERNSGGDSGGAPDTGDAMGPSVPGTVVVNPATTVGTIGPASAGLSYEKAHMTAGFFTGSNGPLIAMFNLLGPSVLRIGGNTVDQTTLGRMPTSKPSGRLLPRPFAPARPTRL